MSLPLLSEIAAQGISIRVNGDNLTVSRDGLTDSLLVQIRENKPALLASLTRLTRYAADDEEWQEFISDPTQFEGYISSVVAIEQRQHRQIPSHYTATVHCKTCNHDVPHFPVDGDTVGACVWCMNGLIAPCFVGYEHDD